MIPVVTPEEMGEIDRAAPEPTEVLIGRAGAAVAHHALDLMGGAYGRRVVVVAGKGNNGADGRAAAARLRHRGARVEVFAAGEAPEPLPPCHLVIDAAFGTGFRGTYDAPRAPAGALVLAVDIPSGIDGVTGVASGRPLAADRTVTFAALKPGLLFGDGPGLAGEVVVADIGLDVEGEQACMVQAADVAVWVPARPSDTHKWRAAAWLVAGSPGMTGAAHLATVAAQRAGAGYVRLSSPGIADDPFKPAEAVGVALPAEGWAAAVIEGAGRFGAVAVGPGLGTGAGVADGVRALVAGLDAPLVIDGDGLTALGADAVGLLAPRTAPTVLTPHDGELARLGADADDPDHIAVTRSLAAATGAVVLRKGPTTVVAAPDGAVLLCDTGDARLATAGTGDVLTGIVAALVAQGVAPFEAAASAAFLHGRAGALAWRRGLVAGDVADHLPHALAELPEA